MKKGLLFNFTLWIFVILLTGSCAGTRKTVASEDFESAEEWVHFLFDTAGVHSGLYMIEAGKEPEKQKPIIDYHSHSLFTPASNTKILTLYASLKFLPEKINAFYWRTSNDTTYLRGTGDPTFLDPRFDSEPALSFLKEQKHLVYLSDWSEDERWGPGWAWDDYPYYYSPQRSPFPIYGNVLRASCRDGEWNFSPRGFILNDVHHPKGMAVKRNESSNIFQVNRDRCGEDDFALRLPFIWNPEVFTELLGDTIGKPVEWKTVGDPEQHDWSSFAGSDRDSLLRVLMYPSDNLIAEQLAWNISSSLWDTMDTKRMIDSLMNTDFEKWKGKIRWADGSGLSVYNAFSPRFISELLHRLYVSLPEEDLLRFFPAGGVRGTISSWYGAEDGPYVFAKTGTLSGVHTLSGYLLADSGKTYIFSFMHNNYIGSSNEYKRRMEILLRWLKENY